MLELKLKNSLFRKDKKNKPANNELATPMRDKSVRKQIGATKYENKSQI